VAVPLNVVEWLSGSRALDFSKLFVQIFFDNKLTFAVYPDWARFRRRSVVGVLLVWFKVLD
jgi:hypothetical protein